MARTFGKRLLLISLVALFGLALSFSIDDSGASALNTLPGDNGLAGASGGLLYAAQPDETILVSTDGTTWARLEGAVPAHVEQVAASPAAPERFYVATAQGLYATADAGRSWQPSQALSAEVGPLTALAFDPRSPDLLYVGSADGSLWKVTDNGASVQPLDAPALAGKRINSLLVNPADTDLIYALTDGGLFRSESAGFTWSDVAGLPATVTALTLSPAAPATLYAAEGTRLWRSDDAGAAWEAIGPLMAPGLPSNAPIVALAQDSTDAQRLYAATEAGQIAVSMNAGQQWAPLGQVAGSIRALQPVVGDQPAVRAVVGGQVHLVAADRAAAAAAVQDEVPATRRAAARLLAASATPAEAELLLTLLDDADGEVATFAALGLSRVADVGLTQRLLERLATQRDLSYQQRLLLALRGEGAAAAVPVLNSMLREQPAAARAAAEALARIGTREARQVLDAASQMPIDSPQYQAATAALAVLTQAPPASALDPLPPLNPTLPEQIQARASANNPALWRTAFWTIVAAVIAAILIAPQRRPTQGV